MQNNYIKKLGQRIAKERKKQRLSLRELAKRSGISDVQLARIENGPGTPNLTTIEKIAKGLGQSLSELITGYSANEINFIMITSETELQKELGEYVSDMPTVQESYLFTRLIPEVDQNDRKGILLKIAVPNGDVLKQFILDKLRLLKGSIRDTASIRVLDEYYPMSLSNSQLNRQTTVGGFAILDIDYEAQWRLGSYVAGLENVAHAYVGQGHADLIIEVTLTKESELRSMVNDISDKRGVKICSDLLKLERIS